MNFRHFRLTDTPELIKLFQNTVQTVCQKDYSQEQLDAWAPDHIDATEWSKRLKNCHTLVAVDDNEQILGFASLAADGCIDMFYVSASTQAQGVGTLLYNALEDEAKKRGLERLYSDVSLSARKFFATKGFTIEKEYSKEVGQVSFLNAIMEKRLT